MNYTVSSPEGVTNTITAINVLRSILTPKPKVSAARELVVRLNAGDRIVVTVESLDDQHADKLADLGVILEPHDPTAVPSNPNPNPSAIPSNPKDPTLPYRLALVMLAATEGQPHVAGAACHALIATLGSPLADGFARAERVLHEVFPPEPFLVPVIRDLEDEE